MGTSPTTHGYGIFILALAAAAYALTRHQLVDIRLQTRTLLAAAAARFPDDERIPTAAAAVKDVVDYAPEDMVDRSRRVVRRGKFDRDVGVLRLATTRPNGKALDPAIVRGILVHEVAHAALPDGRHTPEWRDLYIKLLRVATADLGWDVLLECGSCKFYGVCTAGECPRCAWKPCRDARDAGPRLKND